MKKVFTVLSLVSLLVVMVLSGCEIPEKDMICDGTKNNYCQLQDGNWGIYECVDGDFGECIPQEPPNAPPCAFMIETELTDNMTLVADCMDGEYVQCQIEPFIYKDTPYEGIYCEKIFENGDIFAWFFPFVTPDKYGCFLLNILCCNSNARDCAEEETEE